MKLPEKVAPLVVLFKKKWPVEWEMGKNLGLVLIWMLGVLLLEFVPLYLFGINKSFLNPFLQALPFYLMLAGIPLCLGRIGARIYLGLLLPLLTLFYLIAAILSYRFRVEFDGDAIFVILASSRQEIEEFVEHVFGIVPVCLSVLVAVGIGFAVWKLLRRRWRTTVLTALIGVGLCLPYAITLIRYSFMGEISKSMTRTTITRLFYGTWDFSREFGALVAMVRNPHLPETPIHLTNPEADQLFGVIVIGESACRNHMGLYGYSRDTDPEMRLLKPEIALYKDVLSAYASTTWALRYLLTQSEIGDKKNDSRCSLVDLYKAAGYRVVLYSNQYRWGKFDGPITMLFSHVDNIYYLQEEQRGSFDDSLVPKLVAELNDAREKPVLVFLHLIGSHADPANRYPGDWGPFSGKRDSVTRGVEEEYVENINAYDNSIAFTDHVLVTCIRELKKSRKKAFLLYISDHGCVIDDGNKQLRSAASMDYDAYEVPLIVWLSPEYRSAFPGLSKTLFQNVSLPLQSDRLFWGITALGQISFDGFPESENFLSASFLPSAARYLRDGAALYQK